MMDTKFREVDPKSMLLTEQIIIVLDFYHNVIANIMQVGEFEELMTLQDVMDKYPKAFLVIAESQLSGRIFRIGNYPGSVRLVGYMEGFA